MPMRKEAAVSTGAAALSVMLAQDGLVAWACIGHVGHKGQLCSAVWPSCQGLLPLLYAPSLGTGLCPGAVWW